ncbi:hypothetical protein LQF76_08925 [Gloeomargaritales cyanobacterium VI4D9]|nr:hypothetical protein LQF76_08925 [Gloeomargaritales cyanobacterium VI4D9]
MKITILSQDKSWINRYISEWVTQLSVNYEVEHCHTQDKCQGGDILFILSFWQKVEQKIIDKYNISLVVHGSNLPKGRGWSPVSWQILEGINKIPIVLFKATSKIDAGKIYLRDEIELEGHELIDEIRYKQVQKTIQLCERFITLYPNILAEGFDQVGEPTYYRRRVPYDSKLDISKSIESQFNLLRIVDNENYPAFFEYRGKRYVIKVYKEK